jgi:hypothetical protein
MNLAIRQKPLRHSMGDLVQACFAVPQNPIVKGLSGLSGMAGIGLGDASYTESFTWGVGQQGYANGTLKVANPISSVVSMTCNGRPQTVSTYSGCCAQAHSGPPDFLWYYQDGTAYLAPTYPPPDGTQITIVYTGSEPPATIPTAPPIYAPSTSAAISAMTSPLQPSVTQSILPSVISTAQNVPSGFVARPAPMNPASLMKPLPQIVTHNPLPDVTPMCGDSFASWVDQNKLLVAAGLIAAYFMVSKKGGAGI